MVQVRSSKNDRRGCGDETEESAPWARLKNDTASIDFHLTTLS